MARISIALNEEQKGRVAAYIEAIQDAEVALKATTEFAIFTHAQQTFHTKTAAIAAAIGIKGPFQVNTEKWTLEVGGVQPDEPPVVGENAPAASEPTAEQAV